MDEGISWRVCGSFANGKKYWFVYRVKSVCAPDMAGNRIYYDECFDTFNDAQRFARLLNNIRGVDYVPERKDAKKK